MMQWGRAEGYVALVAAVREVVGALLCYFGYHKGKIVQPSGTWTRWVICDRCGAPF